MSQVEASSRAFTVGASGLGSSSPDAEARGLRNAFGSLLYCSWISQRALGRRRSAASVDRNLRARLALRMRPAAASRGPGWRGGRLWWPRPWPWRGMLLGLAPGAGAACPGGLVQVGTEPAPPAAPRATAQGRYQRLSALDWHSPAVAPYFGPGAAEARPRMEENPRSSEQSAAYFAQAPPPGGSAGQPRPESAALDAPSLRSELIQLDSRVWNLEPKEMAPSLSMSDLRCWDQLLGP